MFEGVARVGALCTLIALTNFAHAEDWQPVSPEDLQLTREPKAPTASAIYLYRQVDRDDDNSQEGVYARIKILTDEGRKLANVEIAYVKDSESIRGLQARTIHPDGTITEFDGTVYEKPLVKARGYRMMSKSFTLPGVEVGSIIEYRYRRSLPYGWVFNSKWLISDDLFTRRAVFSLRPSPNYALRWSWPMGLPADTQEPIRQRSGVIRMEAHDVPAFVTEEYMPPEDAMKYRVEFIYEGEETDQKDAGAYWKAFNKRVYSSLTKFVRDERALKQEAARLVAPGDSKEVKARKLYARAQQITNTTFERQRTEQEEKRDKRAEIHSASDVLKRGYGDADEINWLLYGLLRAAGLDAHVVLVPPRDRHLFDARLMNARELTTCVLLINFDDSSVFLDAGTPFMPFAILPWSETGVSGLLLAENGKWLTTSLPGPTESRVERKVAVKLTSGGSLEGKVTVTYTGLESAWRRVAERHDDDTERKKFLEGEIEADVPTGIEVKLTNTPDWTGADTPLVAEFDFKAPGWAAYAGNRALVPVGLFGGSEKHTFEHSARVHPLYFMFPYQHTDEVSIELPSGWQANSIPKPRATDAKVAKYSMSAQANGATLSLKRELVLSTIVLQTKFYSVMRDFYQTVRAGDEDQVVVTPAATVTPTAAKH